MIFNEAERNHGVALHDQDNDGEHVELNVPNVDLYSGYLSTTSTILTTLANGPTGDVTVGASGICLAISAALVDPAGGQTLAALCIDGSITNLQIFNQPSITAIPY